MKSLVSIITPTWQRHDLLLQRCMPSVQAQDYPYVEHVIVSDGPDPVLRAKVKALCSFVPRRHPVRFLEIPERASELRYGGRARRYGIERAQGSLIGYNDDDDSLRPDHVSKLVAAIMASGSDWARSQMLSYDSNGAAAVIGNGPPAACNIGTPMVLHKRELLQTATWGEDTSLEDWELFGQWVAAGYACELVDEVTVDVWPSVYHGK